MIVLHSNLHGGDLAGRGFLEQSIIVCAKEGRGERERERKREREERERERARS